MVNNYYVVRNIGCWEVRNSEAPEEIWGKFNSEEEARTALKEAYINQAVKSRLGQFLEDTAEILNIPRDKVQTEIRGLL